MEQVIVRQIIVGNGLKKMDIKHTAEEFTAKITFCGLPASQITYWTETTCIECLKCAMDTETFKHWSQEDYKRDLIRKVKEPFNKELEELLDE